jgi:hypothetical protein
MTDKKIETTDLQKAMAALQDLAKGHKSGGTATTEVPGMTGESGSTQLFHTASNSDPGGWAGSSWRGEGWEDMIEANGTDLGAVRKLGKSIATAIQTKLTKGEALSARETNFVVKGGMNFLAEKDDDKKDMDKSHADAAEDKKQIKEMVKPSAIAKGDVSKSLLDHAAEDASVSRDLDVSEFLAGFAQVVHKSLQSMEARVSDRVLTAIAKSDSQAEEVQKSLAGSLAALGEVLTLHAQRIEQVESGAARPPKSIISKGQGAIESPVEAGGNGLENMTKSQINDKIGELVQKGQATVQEALKYDHTGLMSDALARKVLGR